MSRAEASRAVQRAVDAQWNREEFAELAGISRKTLVDFIEGRRWPHGPNRTKVEAALGWPVGRIADIATGRASPDNDSSSTEEAIRADPKLLPEAREHLLNQYRLLLRIRSEAEQAARAQVEAADRAVLDEVGRGDIRLVEDMERAPRPNEG